MKNKYYIKSQSLYALCFLLCLFMLSTASFGVTTLIKPEASWVQQLPIPKVTSQDNSTVINGTDYLILSKQIFINHDTTEIYYKIVKKIVNNAGVEKNAILSVDYDASLEKIAFHTVKIIRNNNAIDALKNNPIHINQHESSLSDNIYDHVKTATIILKDLEAGDIISYSYSLIIKKSVVNIPFSANIYLAYEAPIHTIYDTVTAPRSQKLFFKHFNTKIKPTIHYSNTFTHYSWVVKQAKAITVEKNSAEFENLFPSVQISSCGSWDRIVAILQPLYHEPNTLSAALKNKVDEIKSTSTNNQQRVQKILDFVQQNIRYTGIEIGINNIKPTSPNLTFQRKFGDCKDKALLMVTMLRQMNINANVALVSTSYRKQLKNRLPALWNFDHAIVVVNTANKTFWLDPTRLYQAGSLDTRYLPDYGYALVIAPHINQLTPIVNNNQKGSKTIVDEVYDLKQGMNKPINYQITTHYYGKSAERIRFMMENYSASKITSYFLRTIKPYYPNIESTADLKFIDNQNEMTTIEKYQLTDFWKDEDDNSLQKFAKIKQFILNGYLQDVDDLKRKQALLIDYPFTTNIHVKILLPKKWQIKPLTISINNPIFYFKKQVDSNNKTIAISYDYFTKQDSVPLGLIKKYSDAINRIEENYLSNIITSNGD